MVTIKLNDIIDNTTLSYIQSVVESTLENEVTIDINSNGGDLNAAIAIYDYIRTTDKKWFTNIEGNCHSAAVIILLAAPLENRSANPLATSLIHQIYTPLRGDYNNNELEKIAEELKAAKERMAAIYADRTNLSLEEAIMVIEEEKERDAEWLYDNGFISKLNIYISNMKKGIIMNLKNLLGLNNFDVKDADGNVLFTTEKTEFEVGDDATPDGVFEVPEVGTVTIVEGVITEISKAEEVVEEPKEEEKEEVKEELNEEIPITIEEPKEEVVDEEKEALKAEVEKLKAELAKTIAAKESEVEKLKEALNDALEAIKELKSQIKSDYKPEERMVNHKAATVSSYEEMLKSARYLK